MQQTIHLLLLCTGLAVMVGCTKDSISLIAELSGFSRSSFFRIFSEAYGMSPSDYRRVARK